MSKVDNVNALAKQIAQRLDDLDGKDGNIKKDTWNSIFNVKAKDGNEISRFIKVSDAEKAILNYVKKNKEEVSKQDLLTKWLKELTKPEEKANEENSVKNDAQAQSFLTDVPEYQHIEPAVSTAVARPLSVEATEINSQNNLLSKKENSIIDIDDYAKVDNINEKSPVKATNEELNGLNGDILSRALDSEITRLMTIRNKKKSVLLGTAKDFLNVAKEKQVDVFVLMAITMLESTYGTSSAAIMKNNVTGSSINGRTSLRFTSVADSINCGAETLNNNVYKKNLNSIASVGKRGNYCSGTTRERNNWVKNVTIFADNLRDAYNRLLVAEQEKA